MYLRKIEELGHIIVPSEVKQALCLNDGDKLANGYVIVKRKTEFCCVCKSEMDLVSFNEQTIKQL